MAQATTLKPRRSGTKDLRKKIIDLESISTKVKDNLPLLPAQSVADQAALDQSIVDLKALAGREETLIMQLREAAGTRQKAVLAGTKIRNRLAHQVLGTFGPESEKVLDFGLLPRLDRFRRQSTPAAPATSGATDSTSTTGSAPASPPK